MKTENLKELELIENEFDVIDLDTFTENLQGGSFNICKNGSCKAEAQV